MVDIELRLAKTWDECIQCEELQRAVWQMPDYRDVVPANLLITAIKNGGLLVGGFQGARMVGFAFGFLGSEGEGAARQLKHTSHMLGVLPEFRSRGLGAALKWKQRELAMRQGLRCMTWTYDPLQSVNAELNFKLGVVARRYLRNAYGEMTDALNAGLESDRFEVEWFLASERVWRCASGETSAEPERMQHSAYEIGWDAAGFPLVEAENGLGGAELFIEIPAQIGALKLYSGALARDWRYRTRATFERAFAAGYAATDFQRKWDENGRSRVGYVLRQDYLTQLEPLHIIHPPFAPTESGTERGG